MTVTINGRVLAGRSGETILTLARRSGVDIPALCAESRLDPFDSCGVCAVEVEGAGVVKACSTPIKEGMVVSTASPAAEGVRRTALELLLSYHFGDCVGPCQLGCPAHTDCQGYVSLAANGLFLEGLKLLYEKLPFPASFGRICPAPCEDACRRQIAEEPIQIRHMKRFLGDQGFDYLPERDPDTGFHVAVVGGGPAGCTAAYFLRRRGHAVTVFDAMPKMGGMLRYGIPDFRLAQDVLDRELGVLQRMGITFQNGVRLGKDLTLADLERKYDAVFLGLGAWNSRGLSIPHEDHPDVQQGIDFLRRLNTGERVTLPRRVAVIGGGNTAMDACRSARRLGAEVTLVYRRSRDEMPAIPHEVEEAEEEGVEFRFLTQPVEFLVEGRKLTGIRCLQMRLGDPDASGRAKPVAVPGSEFVIPVDAAILAVGQTFEPASLADSGLRFDRAGTMVADPETGHTDRPKVFAGGDAVTGPGIAIEAVAAGRRAADAIDQFVRGLPIQMAPGYAHTKEDVTRADLGDIAVTPRVATVVRTPQERVLDSREYMTDFTADQAREEGTRCLGCGCSSGFDCALRDVSSAAHAAQDAFAGELDRKLPDERHPFIVRDRGKCIACGRCLRVCSDVCGIHAIDFAGRGIHVEVQAPFDRAWQESTCVSCGACVDACPTGALADRGNLAKQVPLRAQSTRTTCSLCSLACPIQVRTLGGHYLTSGPAEEEGILCVKGRYGWQAWSPGSRIAGPLVRRDKKLIPASWDEAFQLIRDHLPKEKDRTWAIAAGDLSNEEGHLLARLAQSVLKTAFLEIEHFRPKSAFVAPARLVASAEHWAQADLLLVVGPRSRYEHFVLDLLLRSARSKGTPTASLSRGFPDADLAADGGDVVHALSELCRPRSHSAELEAIRTRIASATRPLFVFEERALSREALQGLCDLAVAHPNGRLVPVRALSNQNGLLQAGFDPRLDREPNRRSLSAAVVVGADLARDPSLADELAKLDLVVALAPRENRTTALAHVVLPLALPLEGRGHVVDTYGRLCERARTAVAPAGRENWEILVALAAALGADWSYPSWEALSQDAALTREERLGAEESVFLPGRTDSRAVEVEEALKQKGI